MLHNFRKKLHHSHFLGAITKILLQRAGEGCRMVLRPYEPGYPFVKPPNGDSHFLYRCPWQKIRGI